MGTLPPKSRLPTAGRAHLVRKHLKCVVFQSLFPLTGFPVNGNNAPRIPTADCRACKSDSFMLTTLKHHFFFLQILIDLLEIDSRQGWRDASLARGNGRARQGSRLTMLASETASTLPREGAEQRSIAIACKSVACAASSGSPACPAQTTLKKKIKHFP